MWADVGSPCPSPLMWAARCLKILFCARVTSLSNVACHARCLDTQALVFEAFTESHEAIGRGPYVTERSRSLSCGHGAAAIACSTNSRSRPRNQSINPTHAVFVSLFVNRIPEQMCVVRATVPFAVLDYVPAQCCHRSHPLLRLAQDQRREPPDCEEI